MLLIYELLNGGSRCIIIFSFKCPFEPIETITEHKFVILCNKYNSVFVDFSPKVLQKYLKHLFWINNSQPAHVKALEDNYEYSNFFLFHFLINKLQQHVALGNQCSVFVYWCCNSYSVCRSSIAYNDACRLDSSAIFG